MKLKMVNFIKTIFFFLFPIIETYFTTKRLLKKKEKVENGDSFEYVPNYKELKLEELENIQEETFEYKKILEDKAKISAIGISVSTSIALGLLTFLIGFFDSHLILSYVKFLILFLSFFSLSNMLMAGFFSLKLIGDLNVFYKTFPAQMKLPAKEKKELLAKNIEINVIYNILRNNHLYASYKSLISSIFYLICVFVIVLLPIHTKAEDKSLQEINQRMSHVEETLNDLKFDLADLENSVASADSFYENEIESLKFKITTLEETIDTIEQEIQEE